MTTQWTVQCGYAAYYANTVVVEAETLEAALERAIETANADPCWKALDHCGDTFIDAVAKGADEDPWKDFGSAQPVPDRFCEHDAPPVVTVIVSGGMVQDVTVTGGRAHVVVHDYDTDGDADLPRDHDGKAFAPSDWGVLS